MLRDQFNSINSIRNLHLEFLLNEKICICIEKKLQIGNDFSNGTLRTRFKKKTFE